jgi:hypothetical protein
MLHRLDLFAVFASLCIGVKTPNGQSEQAFDKYVAATNFLDIFARNLLTLQVTYVRESMRV